MIKFSWKKINDILHWNAVNVLNYFYLKQGIKPIPYLRYHTSELVKQEVKKPYIPGNCYLLNIDDALRNASDPQHLYIYLELASKRNIFDYRMRGTTTLPIALVPEYQQNWIEYNPMLHIENEKIMFIYEQEKQ